MKRLLMAIWHTLFGAESRSQERYRLQQKAEELTTGHSDADLKNIFADLAENEAAKAEINARLLAEQIEERKFWQHKASQYAAAVKKMIGEKADALAKAEKAEVRIVELEAALELIRDRKPNFILPWTHEAAANEYARMLFLDGQDARTVLLNKGER